MSRWPGPCGSANSISTWSQTRDVAQVLPPVAGVGPLLQQQLLLVRDGAADGRARPPQVLGSAQYTMQ